MAKIAVIGNYLPRQCGIATFTSDLCDAFAGQMKKCDENLIAVAMDDMDEGYDYPERVKFQIRANVQPDYIRAADFLMSTSSILLFSSTSLAFLAEVTVPTSSV